MMATIKIVIEREYRLTPVAAASRENLTREENREQFMRVWGDPQLVRGLANAKIFQAFPTIQDIVRSGSRILFPDLMYGLLAGFQILSSHNDKISVRYRFYSDVHFGPNDLLVHNLGKEELTVR
jgi:hypothetical protein